MYQLYADGSAILNPRRGGWGFVLRLNDVDVRSEKGYENHRGTNRMELTAVIQGLRCLDEPSAVTIYTDSLFVLNGLRRPVVMQRDIAELWVELKAACLKHTITFKKVGSGNPHPQHRRAHHLAREAVFTEVTDACRPEVCFQS